MEQLQILIAEDHSIVRVGMIFLIKELHPEAQVVEAATFKGALQQLEHRHFDMVLLDINIPGGDSIQMISQLRQLQPGVPVLVVSSYDEDLYAIRYLKAGANGYIEKETEPAELKNAIQKVLAKQTYASTSVQEQLVNNLARKESASNPFLDLSNREIEIMRLLAKGLTSSEIKNKLNIQLSTISTHKARIMEKLQVTNVVELAEKLKDFENRAGNNPMPSA